MSNEEKEYEELKSLLYTGQLSQYGKRKFITLIENLIAENKELKEQEDYTSVYLKGVYDEREKWQNKIKEEIEELDRQEFMYKRSALQSLLGKE